MVKSSKIAALVTAKRRKPTAKTRSQPKTIFISQTVAKSKFLTHCRDVITNKQFVCIKDHSNKPFLTLTVHPVKGVAVTVTAQFFKDNFARCTSLIRDGIVFRLKLRNSKEVLYARRHTSYKDPVDAVIDEWRESIVKAAGADKSEVLQLSREIIALKSQQSLQSVKDSEVNRERFDTLVRGIARMAIGHRPFDEGELGSRRDRDPDTAY